MFLYTNGDTGTLQLTLTKKPLDITSHSATWLSETDLRVPQLGRYGGQVVSVFAFKSDNPSSNPAEVLSKNCLKDENKHKEAGNGA